MDLASVTLTARNNVTIDIVTCAYSAAAKARIRRRDLIHGAAKSARTDKASQL